MKLSLLLALIGVIVFGYGWFVNPPTLSLIELLQMEELHQQAYYQETNRATFMQLGGCVLIGVGLVSFVIIRSVKIHKKQ